MNCLNLNLARNISLIHKNAIFFCTGKFFMRVIKTRDGGISFICQEVLDRNMAGACMSAPPSARTYDRRIRRPRLKPLSYDIVTP